jgi:glycerophosphoryl diester phosphodiesterase
MLADRGPAGAPAISAHRGGGEGTRPATYEAYRRSLAAGADFIEVDARTTRDGTLVASHRARFGLARPVPGLSYLQLCRLAGYEVPRLAEVVPLLQGRAGLHLDVKDPGCAVAAAELALDQLGPEDVIATTRELAVARLIADRFPALQVGLAVGGDAGETARFAARRAVRPGLSRLDAVAAAGAGWAALHHRQASAGLAAQCRARGIRTLVWTVNADDALARWLASPDVDVLVTDRPARAVALRSRRASPAADPDRAAPPGPPDAGRGPAPERGR